VTVADVEHTLLLIKPDAVRRGLVGEILSRVERKGLRIRALELRTIDDDLARRHYAEHAAKPFFADLVAFITSGPLVAAVIEGPRAVETLRTLMGSTDPVAAPPGTIRGDFGLLVTENLVHGSDSVTSAAREIALFFPHFAADA
jgi:nucleoside-diphosphate kinase